MCNKVPYPTKKDAAIDATFIKIQARHFKNKARKSPKGAKKLRPYFCKYCGNWHLTSQKIKTKRKH